MIETATGEQLLKAIIADPDADDLRLIYADWLEEHNPPFWDVVGKATLIREMVPHPTCGILLEHGERPKKLGKFSLSGKAWLMAQWKRPENICSGELDRFNVRAEEFQATAIRRGFVDEIRCSLAFWLKHGRTLVAAHPVTQVELIDATIGQSATPLGWTGGERWRIHLPDCELLDDICASSIDMYFPSKPLAQAALSAWCLKLARV